LIFHIKRFSESGNKILNPIWYPDNFDISEHLDESDLEHNKVTKYKLISLQEHSGRRINRGHYIAHVLRNGSYYKFDDEVYNRVPANETLCRSDVYILFYQLMTEPD
jgi:ubiquitin C-terminal hydrolase